MDESNEPKQRGSKNSQQGLYAKFEPLTEVSIKKLSELIHSNNENIALGAIKLVLERTIPAKKAIEITGENGEPIKLNIISGSDYVSSIAGLTTSSEASSVYGPAKVQGSDMAQKVQKDDNSNKSDSKVEST